MGIVEPETEDTVGKVYGALRAKASSFAFKPGERINESALSRELGASRTPLREALNRLAAEGFVDIRAGRGFYCRELSGTRIRHLYQARMAIECEAVRAATARATADDIAAIRDWLGTTAADYAGSTDPGHLLELDEAFHDRVTGLSANPELARMLVNIYDKIRFVRMADLRMLRAEGGTTTKGHLAILDCIAAGDPAAAAEAMRSHIAQRAPHAAEAVRHAFADLYAPQS
ncbi:GntR family transcriptional regulator [Jannaschia sp. S6380]|uniref:GntR family transcriptional regulator n=1 Tax=Jannaschia sp. S6380 TaxID=2926408 RepID=UPI001FF6D5FF|nr:GntR family transcriptional regulator [Jannaschia sp. S6380]MCK0169033.1 GntR family transcriptional regulator [Jannaschia sp. S6380]